MLPENLDQHHFYYSIDLPEKYEKNRNFSLVRIKELEYMS